MMVLCAVGFVPGLLVLALKPKTTMSLFKGGTMASPLRQVLVMHYSEIPVGALALSGSQQEPSIDVGSDWSNASGLLLPFWM